MNEITLKIYRALRTVYDPDLKQDLVSLGMVEDLTVQDHIITFTLILTTPACPLQERMKQLCKQAIHAALHTTFTIIIQTKSRITSIRQSTSILPHVKNVVAIASGKGGVGKSTLASHLALILSQYGARVGLLDADIFDPSIPIIWGCAEEKPAIEGSGNEKKMIPIEKYGVQLLSMGFLIEDQESIVWRGPMASSALKQLLKETSWGKLDYLFIDLPPGTSDIHLTLVKTGLLTGVLIVTTPQKVACIGASKAIHMFNKKEWHVPILGLVENMSYISANKDNPSANPLYIFGKDGGKELAKKANVPFLGDIPLLPEIAIMEDMAPHMMIPPLDALVQKLTQQIAIVNAQHTAKISVQTNSH